MAGAFSIMKKNTKTFLIRTLKIFGIFGIVLLLWIALAVFNIHCRLLTLGMLQMADIYKSVGTVLIHTENGVKSAQIYKQNNKPFLLIGPHKFANDCNDFFFVTKDYVLTTATDKGSEWTTWGNYLIVNDDMTQWDRLRMPFTYEADKNDGRIKLNPQHHQYDFNLDLDNNRKQQVSFSIPAKYFTADMPNAELFFDCDKIPPPWIIRMFRKVVSP